jgi:hypothetical protein
MTLKTINAELEIELSDALDVKNAMEAEVMKMRAASQDNDKTIRDEIEKITDKNTKLESVLSIVVEENSNLYKGVSTLREENRMLKNYNIREIADGSTQVSPRTTEDEADNRKIYSTNVLIKKLSKSHDETPIINVSSPGFQNPPESASSGERNTELSFSKALLELPIK